MYDIIEVVI